MTIDFTIRVLYKGVEWSEGEMLMIRKLFDFVFCCLSQEQRDMVYAAAENNHFKAVYDAQQNLLREKHGYRCSVCGKFYPSIELDYQNARIDPGKYAKVTGSLRKGKKAAAIFRKRFYYALNKKSLIKFEADPNGMFQETDALPVMADVYHSILSEDGKYIATETFGGTIAVLDVVSKQCIAKKRSVKINGQFIFTQDHKILFFHKEKIILWDFCRDAEQVVWSVPTEWKNCEEPQKQIHIVCSNIIYNRQEQTYLFVCDAREKVYVVALRDMQLKQVVELPGKPVLSELVFEENLNRYTLPTQDAVIVYDADFRVLEVVMPPKLVQNHDGGGMFPVTRHVTGSPRRTFLSPDGKWLLLDYGVSVILMGHEDLEIRYCLYSDTGKMAQCMGFVDSDHFWYTWGNTTYIQEMKQ